MPFHVILCPVDFSAPSRKALRYAASLARASKAQVVALFVTDPMLAAAAAASYDAEAIARSTDTELKRFVRQVLARSVVPLRAVRVAVAVGKPPGEIVDAARRLRADLIVMGTRGLSGASRLVLGSTTDHVLRHAGVPVLAVPPGASGVRSRARTKRRART